MKTKIFSLILAAALSSTASAAFDFSVVELTPYDPGTFSGQVGIVVDNITPGPAMSASSASISLALNSFDTVTSVSLDGATFSGGFAPFIQSPATLPASFSDGGEFYISGFGLSPASFENGDTVLTLDYSIAPGEALAGASFDISVLTEGSLPGSETLLDGVAPTNVGTATVAVPEPSSVIFFSLVSVGLVFRFWKNRTKK